MDNKRLQYLLKRYQISACSDEEKAELNNWYHSLNYDEGDFASWVNKAGGEENLADTLFEDFEIKLKKRSNIITIKRVVQGMAATILLMVSIGLIFQNRNQNDNSLPKKNKLTDVKPGKNKAILTLADGSKIILDDAGKGILTNQAGVIINKNKNGQLVYTVSKKAGANYNTTTAYNSVETPRGGQYEIQLADGTKVWLNAGSLLRFPLKFDNKSRNVELQGEGYFEVAHNNKVPFKVLTGKQEVKVLGTHFNIKGYADESGINTTLLTGKVMVSNLTSKQSQVLIPGQQAKISKDQDQVAVNSVNVDEVVSWKNGYFIFDNQDISCIMKVISRWYDVDVEYKNLNKEERFGGTFSRSANLSEILNNLQLLGKVHFKIENKKVIVTD